MHSPAPHFWHVPSTRHETTITDPNRASRDFVGQGAANVAAGVFQGMPVGGSLSATALSKQAGARSRQAFVIAGLVMAAVVVAFAGLVGKLAMPSPPTYSC